MTKRERTLNRIRARYKGRIWKIFLVSPCKEKIEVWFYMCRKEIPTKKDIMSLVEGQLNRFGIRSGQPRITAIMEARITYTKKYGVAYEVING